MAYYGYIQGPTFHPSDAYVRSRQLNPMLPSFEPNGQALQRFHDAQAASESGMFQMQRYIADMNISHVHDMAAVNQRSRDLADSFQDLKDTVKQDLRELEQRISAQQCADDRSDEAVVGHNRHDSFEPMQQWRENFSEEELAKHYLAEADVRERMAVDLRKQASELLGEKSEEGPAVKMIEHSDANEEPTSPTQNNALKRDSPTPPNMATQGNTDFACCNEGFSSLALLLEHVQEKHAMAKTVVSADTSPTPPGRLARLARQRANGDPFVARSAQGLDRFLNVNRSNSREAANAEPKYPYAVSQMRPFTADIPQQHTKTFTWEFLRSELHGEQWSPGFYFESGDSILPSKGYWILEAEHEPFLPSSPGKHGAKLTPFLNETPSFGKAPEPENYLDTPVFIRAKGHAEYRYFGHYSQLRFSDQVSYDDLMTKIDPDVRDYWAKELVEVGRPEWVTKCLTEHFWPRPKYHGPIPTDFAVATPHTTGTVTNSADGGLERRVTKALNKYANNLKNWEKETHLKAKFLTEGAISQSFCKADAAEEPGLRLWLEYLQCVDYDVGFYDYLVQVKQNLKLSKSSMGSTGASRPPTPPRRGTKETDKKRAGMAGAGAGAGAGGSMFPRDIESLKRNKDAYIANMSQETKEKALEASKKLTSWSKPEFEEEPKKMDGTATTTANGPWAQWMKTVEKKKKGPRNSQQTSSGATSWAEFGDLEAAKKMNEELTRAADKAGKGKGRGGGAGVTANAGAGRGVAPHLRARR